MNLPDDQLMGLYWFIYYYHYRKLITKNAPVTVMKVLKDMQLIDFNVAESTDPVLASVVYNNIEIKLKGMWVYWLNKKRIDYLYDQILNYSK